LWSAQSRNSILIEKLYTVVERAIQEFDIN